MGIVPRYESRMRQHHGDNIFQINSIYILIFNCFSFMEMKAMAGFLCFSFLSFSLLKAGT